MDRIIEIYETNIYAIIYFGLMGILIVAFLVNEEFKQYRKNEKIRDRKNSASGKGATTHRQN